MLPHAGVRRGDGGVAVLALAGAEDEEDGGDQEAGA